MRRELGQVRFSVREGGLLGGGNFMRLTGGLLGRVRRKRVELNFDFDFIGCWDAFWSVC